MNETSIINQFEQPFRKETRLVEKQDFLPITILVTIAFVIGIYLITITVLIAKDGCYYIQNAQNFAKNPIQAIKTHYFAYPFFIFITHKLYSLFNNNNSVTSWIYSAQIITLLFRLLATIPLYFIGKILVGNKHSFWGMLILISLPYPAENASDVLREWPHIFFLATALLFLIYGSIHGNWQMFTAAGLFSGFGYMIRPECFQIIIYGIIWLFVSLIFKTSSINKLKVLRLTFILIISFLAVVVPYSKIKGEIIPDKLKTAIYSKINYQSERNVRRGYTASLISKDIPAAFIELAKRTSENLMYFFVLPLIIGFYYHFQKPKEFLKDSRLFTFFLIILYTIMMVLLYINYGHISRRHCMPMIVFIVFYIPSGLLIIADLISRINKTKNENQQKNPQKWFFVLLTAGILICVARLSGLFSAEMEGYRDATKWLNKNTAPFDIIAVPDERITFYAERTGLIYKKEITGKVDYIVKISENGDEELKFNKNTKEEFSVFVNKNKKKEKLVICKVIQ